MPTVPAFPALPAFLALPNRELLEPGAGFGHSTIDLANRLLELRATSFVLRGPQLVLELRSGESQRFERPHLLRITRVFLRRLLTVALELFHPLLNSRVRVD